MKKTTTPERDWLLVGSHSITACGIHSQTGPISGPVDPKHAPESLVRDYGDEKAWSRRIEAEAWIHDLYGDAPDDHEE